ncbi:MAG: site-specific DNA-methyltransferase, partial [Armatimonadetes bacterium CP1_7O]
MQTIQPNHIYLMDCREGMRLIPDESIDLIVTDPPFAIEFGAKRSNYNRTA